MSSQATDLVSTPRSREDYSENSSDDRLGRIFHALNKAGSGEGGKTQIFFFKNPIVQSLN